MKRIILFISGMLCFLIARSQQKTWIDTLFDNISKAYIEEQIKYYGLDSAKVPYGLLYNKVTFANSDFSLYNGAKCNSASCRDWSNAYYDLTVSQLFKRIVDTTSLDSIIVRM